MFVWYHFVQDHNQTGALLGLGNLGMALLIYAGLFIVITKWLGGFHFGANRKMQVFASQVLSLCSLDFLEIFISMAITGQFRFGFLFLGIYFLLFIVQTVGIVLVTNLIIIGHRKIVPPLQIFEIYGAKANLGNSIRDKFDRVPAKYHVAKMTKCPENVEELLPDIKKYDAIALYDLPDEQQSSLIKVGYELGKRVYFLPKLSDIIVQTSENMNLFDTPLALNRNEGISWVMLGIKRFFDIFLSLLALIILSPVFLVVAIAIKRDDGGPVFFRQERVTLGGRKFQMIKFRSMIVDAEKDGKSHPAGENDDRITKVGKVIRAVRIDELPQLINILKGDMSIVGPRPERVEHVEKYTKQIPEFRLREKVRGGLTGYAQVYGKYNTTALDKVKMDLIYITHYSLLLDLQLIFETVKILFQKESTEGFSEERVEEIQNFELKKDDEK